MDEAQLFPPTWLRVAQQWLKPDSPLFLAGDMTQSIYTRFSWRQKGVEVRGRTRILNEVRRSTVQIARAAHTLVSSDMDVAEALRRDGDELLRPNFDAPDIRIGPAPRLVACTNQNGEHAYLEQEIKRLITEGHVWPADIAVFCLRDRSAEPVANHLRSAGLPTIIGSDQRHADGAGRIVVGLLGAITGQEFKAVFVYDLQELFDATNETNKGVSWPEMRVRQKRLLYNGMTRARDELHLCYRQHLHSTLDVLKEVCEPRQVA